MEGEGEGNKTWRLRSKRKGTRDSGWETQNRGVREVFWQGTENEETTEQSSRN
jgi:hypothetical protein